MEGIDNTQLLVQLKALAQQAGINSNSRGHPVAGLEFSQVLKQSLQSVNTRRQNASSLAKSFELGDPNIDLAQVMVAMQKSRVAGEALLQIRNRLVGAYKEIMSMSM